MHKGIGCWVLLAVCFSVQAEQVDGITVLERMSEATKHLSYEGVFSYQSGENLQSIRIYHRSDARGERERLIALTGAAREVIRSNDLVTYISQDGEKVNVSRHPFGQSFPSDLTRRLKHASSYYKVSEEGHKRIAGRQATQLLIAPVDAYRYGYRLWVDDENFLLLKSELIAKNGAAIEVFEFSTVNTGVHIPEQKLQSHLTGVTETLERPPVKSERKAALAQVDKAEKWVFDWLPTGFTSVAHQTRLRSGNSSSVNQYVFNDGLSSISVFIEKIHAHHKHLRGGSNMGGMNAYGTILNDHFVTVVGEVPAVTVEKIGNAIRYTQGSEDD